MQRGRQEIIRLLEEIRRWIKFDSYFLNKTQQDRAEFQVQKMKEFFNGLYDGK